LAFARAKVARDEENIVHQTSEVRGFNFFPLSCGLISLTSSVLPSPERCVRTLRDKISLEFFGLCLSA